MGCCLLAGVLVAGLLFPVAGGLGLVSNRAADTMQNVSSELIEGQVPEVTTMTDVNGKPIAYLYDQRRTQVGYNDISPEMIRAIISVEDRRFLDHDGVDWKGTIRAFLKNQSSGEVQQGASTHRPAVCEELPTAGAGPEPTPSAAPPPRPPRRASSKRSGWR